MTIVLTGGGTAGHVLPHLAVLPHLEKTFEKIYYIGSTNPSERQIIEPKGIKFYPLACVKLRRGFNIKNIWRNMMIPIGFMKSVRAAGKILDELKPDIVFSKGGFVALPVVKASAARKIPVVAHESDASIGLANRLSIKHCTRVCTTFKSTSETCKHKGAKFIFTGSPIRQSIYKGDAGVVTARHFDGGHNARRNLLVMGGSLGAAKVNASVLDAALDLAKHYNIIHVCGRGKKSETKLPRGYVQLEYVDDVENYLAWADVVVSRAGSNALCELAVLGKPVLFIPLSTGRGDQIHNIEEIQKYNAAGVLLEKNLTPETLIKEIESVWQNREMYSSNIKKAIKDGTQEIYDTIYSVVRHTDDAISSG